jgi:mono/diheme cytochrome c family protein
MKHPFFVAALFVVGAGAVGQGQVKTAATPGQPSLSGRETFEVHCAACHGRDGKGDGPYASVLKAKPANLTTLAQRNGGRFPLDRVRALVAGLPTRLPAHGTGEMPVWGPIFQALDASDKTAETRIQNLVAYVQSIQAK